MIYVIGYPGAWGGANSELWHLLKLWRSHDVEVTLIPTWKASDRWEAKVDGIGCHTLRLKAQTFTVSNGSIVVSLCNSVFVKMAHRLRNCRTIWAPCMTYVSDAEKHYYRGNNPLFSAYVFQSRFQRDTLLPQLEEHGVTADRCHLIRGAFDVSEFPYRPQPHRADDPFVIGRLSRPDPKKFSRKSWAVCGAVPNMRLRIMGWSNKAEARLGPPPSHADVLPLGAESPQAFLGSLHAMVQANGGALENWPRVGLEAMATGVPVVVDNQGGWPEMVQHGRTGMLCDDPEGFRGAIRQLAENEPFRMDIASRARSVLEEELACPEAIWAKWGQLFASLS